MENEDLSLLEGNKKSDFVDKVKSTSAYKELLDYLQNTEGELRQTKSEVTRRVLPSGGTHKTAVIYFDKPDTCIVVEMPENSGIVCAASAQLTHEDKEPTQLEYIKWNNENISSVKIDA